MKYLFLFVGLIATMSVQASDPKEPITTCHGAYYISPLGDIIGIYYDADATPSNLKYVTIDSPCGNRYTAEVSILKVKERKHVYKLICEFNLPGYEGWKYILKLPKSNVLLAND